MSRLAARGVVVVSLVLASSVAFAQGNAPAGSAPAAPAGGAAAPAAPADAPPAGDAPKADAPKKPSVPAAGYAFSDKPAPGRHARAKGVKHAAGPVATFPGFEQLPDGGTRVFVMLSTPVQVEERKAQGTVTYVLKGAHVEHHNNTNALVTVHFNTPVARARLVPAGHDLQLVVDLRANAQPTWKMTEAQDKTAMLAVEFPKGDYLAGTSEEANDAEAAKPDRRPASPKSGKGPKGGKAPSAPDASPPPGPGPKP